MLTNQYDNGSHSLASKFVKVLLKSIEVHRVNGEVFAFIHVVYISVLNILKKHIDQSQLTNLLWLYNLVGIYMYQVLQNPWFVL